MHRIYIKNEQKKEAYTPAMRSFIQAAVKETLAYEQFEDQCEVSVTLVDNEKIKALNSEYRNKDRETDVLSFPLLDGEYSDEDLVDGFLPLGDIVISLEKAREQAAELGHNINEEVAFLCRISLPVVIPPDGRREVRFLPPRRGAQAEPFRERGRVADRFGEVLADQQVTAL